MKKFDTIENLIRSGDVDGARTLINSIVFSKLNNKEKIIYTEAIFRTGDVEKAMTQLGDRLHLTEYETIGEDLLAIEALKAYFCHFIGARYLAKQLFEKIDIVLASRNTNIDAFLPKYERYKGYLYQSGHNFKAAYYSFKKAYALSDDDYNRKLISIGLIECLTGVGRYKLALNCVETLERSIVDGEVFLRGITLRMKGEIQRYLDLPDPAENTFREAIKYFQGLNNTVDLGYVYKENGALLLSQGKIALAKENIAKAMEILHRPGRQPIAILELFYYANKAKLLPSFNDQVASKMHTAQSYFSLIERSLRPEKKSFYTPKWVDQNINDNKENCWHLRKQSIEKTTYDRNLYLDAEKVIDLKSGVITSEEGVEFLSELEANTLIAIICAGSIGVHITSLTDFVYREEFIDFKTGLERIKKVIKLLRKKGFGIERNKNNYTIDVSELLDSCELIVPFEFRCTGPLHYVLLYFDSFKRKDLEELLQIKKSRANTWLSDWTNQGLLNKEGYQYFPVQDSEEIAS